MNPIAPPSPFAEAPTPAAAGTSFRAAGTVSGEARPGPRTDATWAALDGWVRLGWLRELDRSFAVFVTERSAQADPLAVLAAAWVSHQLGRGHPALDLARVLDDPAATLALPPPDEGSPEGRAGVRPVHPAALLAAVDADRWRAALRASGAVDDGPGSGPLVLEGTRLSMRRCWQYERTVREAIEARVAAPADGLDSDAERSAVRAAIDLLFGDPAPAGRGRPDWQRIACATALRRRFAIVTGGPGTGKTTTVVRLLALLQYRAMRAPQDGAPRPLRIRMAAPTGKAAARLNESIAGAVGRLPLQALPGGEAVRAAIPTEVVTLHRLLGARPDTRRLRHDASHPLPLDVLVIDEASMVDLEMMAATCEALRPDARLVLLGDKDQLASVEAGAVLGGLCERADDGHYLPAHAAWIEAVTGQRIPDERIDASGRPLDQAIVKLRDSYRFGADSGIGRLADAVNRGDADAAAALLAESLPDLGAMRLGRDDAGLRRLASGGMAPEDASAAQAVAPAAQAVAPAAPGGAAAVPEGPPATRAAAHAAGGYRAYLRVMHDERPPPDAPAARFDAWALAVLRAHAGFQVLCALRRGDWGVEALNERIARLLHAEGRVAGTQGWYAGRPVIVTRNDHALRLINGDVGIALALPAPADPAATVLRVAFPAGDGSGGVRWLSPTRLQSVETAFALTVHKSQGSEFEHVVLVLPDRVNPVLTRELVYTGITRGRSRVTVAAGADDVLALAIGRRVDRH
jgi:exodeoxyribonuclease V alpha subunit